MKSAADLKLNHGLSHVPSTCKEARTKFTNTAQHHLMRGRHADFGGRLVRVQADAPGQQEVVRNVGGAKADKPHTLTGGALKALPGDPKMLARCGSP